MNEASEDLKVIKWMCQCEKEEKGGWAECVYARTDEKNRYKKYSNDNNLSS